MSRNYLLFLLMLTTGIACRERYEPRVEALDKSFLVVEGNLNVNHDSTIIRLTRTSSLDEKVKVVAENNAQLTVEGRNNSIRTLFPMSNGRYVSADLNLDIGIEYRLRIRTNDGKIYLSDFVEAKATPLIDSINAVASLQGVEIFANTKDPQRNTRYYRWDYDETWEIRSFFNSDVIYEPSTRSIRNRLPHEMVYYCWRYDTSRSILLANSTRLSEDIIHRALLKKIDAEDERLRVRYSIRVKQYALEKEAYDFFEQIRQNTESVGSLFSPLPSEIRGNVHCINDPTEYVLGYVTASTVEEKRIFVVYPSRVYEDCKTKTVNSIDSIDHYVRYQGYLLYASDPLNNPPEYSLSTATCVDCTQRGGKTQRPSYW